MPADHLAATAVNRGTLGVIPALDAGIHTVGDRMFGRRGFRIFVRNDESNGDFINSLLSSERYTGGVSL